MGFFSELGLVISHVPKLIASPTPTITDLRKILSKYPMKISEY